MYWRHQKNNQSALFQNLKSNWNFAILWLHMIRSVSCFSPLTCHFPISTDVELGGIGVLHRNTWYGESKHMSTIIRRCFFKRNYIYPAVFWFCFIIQCPSDWGIFTDDINKDKQAIHAGKFWVNHEHQSLRCIVLRTIDQGSYAIIPL